MAWIILGVLVVIAFVLIGMYNSLVQLRIRCDSAWSDIDVQLKRRHDLIPNLVETVKGYAAHEKGTFENIAKFRSQAMQATSPVNKAAAENQLTGALKSLFAVAENYPQLKAPDPPNWYVSPNGGMGFNPIFFSSSMHSMATDMHQVFVSAPRASSTGSGWSGGGGGGFSGGGFGGGGGSAF
jgi:uncharacterized membrane protein YgcG